MTTVIQVDGRFCYAVEHEEPIRVAHVPGKLINVLTKEPTGSIHRLNEWVDANGECRKSVENC